MYTLEIRKGVLQRLLHNYSCVCVSVRRNSSLSYFSAHGASVCVCFPVLFSERDDSLV